MIIVGTSSIAIFMIWTLLIRFVDVQIVGPQESTVGFATLNSCFHSFTETNIFLYILTDWLGLVPIAIAFGFSILGFVQLIKRKSLLNVDHSILALGIFYIVVMAVYAFFEMVVINYRPILINDYLEPSYPSSTTMLVMCIMPTTAIQLNKRIKNKLLKKCVVTAIIIFIIFMIVSRVVDDG